MGDKLVVVVVVVFNAICKQKAINVVLAANICNKGSIAQQCNCKLHFCITRQTDHWSANIRPSVFYKTLIVAQPTNQLFINFKFKYKYLNYKSGFLSTDDLAAPGNLGLYDQIAALRWVKRNIQSFGGNGDDITLMGHNAGAISASLLILAPHETAGK